MPKLRFKSLTCAACGRKGKPEGFRLTYQKNGEPVAACKNEDACRRRAA